MKKPIIGMTLDLEPAGGYSPYPWYALRRNYFDAVARAGAIPVAIPYQRALIEDFLESLHGLVIPGGFFDIHPSRYGVSECHDTVVTKDERTEFDIEITRRAFEKDLPLLGICAGAQLMNVLLGGTLYQHIPDDIENALEHEQKECRSQPSHGIAITENTLLHQIGGTKTAQVNSSHHQAIKDLGAGVVVNAIAPDGVVEGIEIPEKRFCLGVEWHPEYETTDLDRKIFQHFVAEARRS